MQNQNGFIPCSIIRTFLNSLGRANTYKNTGYIYVGDSIEEYRLIERKAIGEEPPTMMTSAMRGEYVVRYMAYLSVDQVASAKGLKPTEMPNLQLDDFGAIRGKLSDWLDVLQNRRVVMTIKRRSTNPDPFRGITLTEQREKNAVSATDFAVQAMQAFEEANPERIGFLFAKVCDALDLPTNFCFKQVDKLLELKEGMK